MSDEKRMDTFAATMIAEGSPELAGYSSEDVTKELETEAWQLLIDTGLAWQLQGWFGRRARDLIEAGVCTLPKGDDA